MTDFPFNSKRLPFSMQKILLQLTKVGQLTWSVTGKRHLKNLKKTSKLIEIQQENRRGTFTNQLGLQSWRRLQNLGNMLPFLNFQWFCWLLMKTNHIVHKPIQKQPFIGDGRSDKKASERSVHPRKKLKLTEGYVCLNTSAICGDEGLDDELLRGYLNCGADSKPVKGHRSLLESLNFTS